MFNDQCSMFNVQRSMFNGLTVFPPGGKGRSHKWDSPFPLVGRVVPTGGTPTYPQVYFQLIKHLKTSPKPPRNITKTTKHHPNITKTSPKSQKHHPNITKTSPKHHPKHHQPTLLIINILNAIGDVSDVFFLKIIFICYRL